MFKLNLKLRRRDISKQIETQIRQSIFAGDVHPGEILPPVKELAAEYGINHQTILKAYAALKKEGLLESSRGGNARIPGVSILKEILVVFDISSFTNDLSPGYQSYFKKMNERLILENVLVSGQDSIPKARLSPFLSPPDDRADFIESPLLAKIDADRERNIIGLLLVGYAASSRMQSYLRQKNIPFVGVGSTGQYACQTIAPFPELINSGVNCAKQSGKKNIAFVYPRQCGIDSLAQAFKASVKAAGLSTKNEWITPIEYSEPLSNLKILRKLNKKEKLYILSADNAATIEILKKADQLKLSITKDFDIFSFWAKEARTNTSYKFPKLMLKSEELFNGALQLLLDLIAGKKKPPCTITVSSELQL